MDHYSVIKSQDLFFFDPVLREHIVSLKKYDYEQFIKLPSYDDL